MAEPLRPAAAKLYGRENWIFVPTIASATLAPTVAEASGASSLDITNIAFSDGAPSPSKNTNLAEQQRRFGDTATYQFVGTTTYGGGDVTYQFDAQGAAASDPVKAWEKFSNASGTVTGYFVNRQNVGKATAITAGQFVHVYPVEIGPSMPVKSGDGEGAEGAAVATFAITSAPAFKVAVLA
jgi:hypothetical protein